MEEEEEKEDDKSQDPSSRVTLDLLYYSCTHLQKMCRYFLREQRQSQHRCIIIVSMIIRGRAGLPACLPACLPPSALLLT